MESFDGCLIQSWADISLCALVCVNGKDVVNRRSMAVRTICLQHILSTLTQNRAPAKPPMWEEKEPIVSRMQAQRLDRSSFTRPMCSRIDSFYGEHHDARNIICASYLVVRENRCFNAPNDVRRKILKKNLDPMIPIGVALMLVASCIAATQSVKRAV